MRITWPGASGGSTGPHRGHKFSLLEGGIRMPAIISWPGRLPENETRDQVVMAADVLPTVSEAIGAALPADRGRLTSHVPHHALNACVPVREVRVGALQQDPADRSIGVQVAFHARLPLGRTDGVLAFPRAAASVTQDAGHGNVNFPAVSAVPPLPLPPPRNSGLMLTLI